MEAEQEKEQGKKKELPPSVLREWILKRLEGTNLRKVANRAGVGYAQLWNVVHRSRPLRDFEVERMLRFYNISIQLGERELFFAVCRTIHVDCNTTLYEVPVYARLKPGGVPDFATQVGMVAFNEKLYAVEVHDERHPFPSQKVVVGYKPCERITEPGFYLLRPENVSSHMPFSPVLRHVIKIDSGIATLRLYNPDDLQVFYAEEGTVVGRVRQVIVQDL